MIRAPVPTTTGIPLSPYGGYNPGNPHERDLHGGHDVASLSSGRREGGPVGRRVCLDCDEVVEPLVLCGQPTKRGFPCRVPVRVDLGFERCWSHGEGRDSSARR